MRVARHTSSMEFITRSDDVRDSTYRHVVQILRDYKLTDRYIQQREEELMYPYRSEEMVGGQGNLPGSPTERMAITISEDRRLSNLENNRNVIDRCLKRADIVTRELIKYMYLEQDHSTIRAAMEMNVSDRHARRLHSKFVEEIANELGLML